MNNVPEIDEVDVDVESLLASMKNQQNKHPQVINPIKTKSPLNSLNHEKRQARKKQSAEDFTIIYFYPD